VSKIKYLSVLSPPNTYEKQYAGFFCPACQEIHYMGVGDHIPVNAPKWSFNFDDEKPVFGPSLLCRWGHHAYDRKTEAECKHCQARAAGSEDHYKCGICHSFIGCNGAQPGQIIFLGDCTHALAGQTVDLPDIPPERIDINAEYEDDERDSA
jgi:hypothetical protein